MIKTVSLNENKLFKRLYYQGKSVAGQNIILYYMPGLKNKNRLGITISKKLGHAVIRNRVKRQIKEAYRLLEVRFITGFDIVIVARKAILNSNFHKIEHELQQLAKKAGIMQ